MKVNQITPNIFVRGNLRNVDIVDLGATLATNGIDMVVSLVGEPLIPVGIIKEYIVYPIADSKLKLSVEVELNDIADKIVARVQAGSKVLVNCNAGRNRSCFLIALALMKLHGWNGKQALDYVRERRPRAIANPHFEEYLLQK